MYCTRGSRGLRARKTSLGPQGQVLLSSLHKYTNRKHTNPISVVNLTEDASRRTQMIPLLYQKCLSFCFSFFFILSPLAEAETSKHLHHIVTFLPTKSQNGAIWNNIIIRVPVIFSIPNSVRNITLLTVCY